jgi:hypothetical protein
MMRAVNYRGSGKFLVIFPKPPAKGKHLLFDMVQFIQYFMNVLFSALFLALRDSFGIFRPWI